MTRHVVIGTGALGSAAAYWLARRAGEEVLVLEQFAPGHGRGASEDHSRIIRHSYQSTAYTRLTRAMYAAWEEVEDEAGMPLVTRTGGLDLALPGVDQADAEYAATQEALGAERIPYELLDAAETMRRWPQWSLPDGTRAIFQADAGVLDIGRACAAHLALARAHGAELRAGATVRRLEPRDDGVRVHLDGEVLDADHVVVCAGRWTNRVLAGVHAFPLRYTAEQVQWFASPRMREFAPERFPIWIGLGEPSFYGFPVHGLPGLKVAQDLAGPPADPGDEEAEVDPARVDTVRAFTARHLPAAAGPLVAARACFYDLTPDRGFVIDAVPGAPRVLVGLGAAHAAKWGSLIGRILADLALDGATPHDIAAFRADRFARD
ncbi:MAG: N-methyl-L-tryptophan oxidase [Solirubrobacteraceae bacterium]